MSEKRKRAQLSDLDKLLMNAPHKGGLHWQAFQDKFEELSKAQRNHDMCAAVIPTPSKVVLERDIHQPINQIAAELDKARKPKVSEVEAAHKREKTKDSEAASRSEEQVMDLEDRVTGLEDKVAELEAAVKRDKLRNANAASEWPTKETDLQTQVEEHRKRTTKLEAQIGEHKTRTAVLQNQVSGIQVQVNGLRVQMEEHRTTVIELQIYARCSKEHRLLQDSIITETMSDLSILKASGPLMRQGAIVDEQWVKKQTENVFNGVARLNAQMLGTELLAGVDGGVEDRATRICRSLARYELQVHEEKADRQKAEGEREIAIARRKMQILRGEGISETSRHIDDDCETIGSIVDGLKRKADGEVNSAGPAKRAEH